MNDGVDHRTEASGQREPQHLANPAPRRPLRQALGLMTLGLALGCTEPPATSSARGTGSVEAAIGACTVDLDCGAGGRCCAGACVVGDCCASEECGGRVCRDHQCQACQSSADCGTDSVCCQGLCRPGACCSSADCEGGALCRQGACVICVSDGDCGSGQRCSGGHCAAGSTCSEGSLFLDGLCLPAYRARWWPGGLARRLVPAGGRLRLRPDVLRQPLRARRMLWEPGLRHVGKPGGLVHSERLPALRRGRSVRRREGVLRRPVLRRRLLPGHPLR